MGGVKEGNQGGKWPGVDWKFVVFLVDPADGSLFIYEETKSQRGDREYSESYELLICIEILVSPLCCLRYLGKGVSQGYLLSTKCAYFSFQEFQF